MGENSALVAGHSVPGAKRPRDVSWASVNSYPFMLSLKVPVHREFPASQSRRRLQRCPVNGPAMGARSSACGITCKWVRPMVSGTGTHRDPHVSPAGSSPELPACCDENPGKTLSSQRQTRYWPVAFASLELMLTSQVAWSLAVRATSQASAGWFWRRLVPASAARRLGTVYNEFRVSSVELSVPAAVPVSYCLLSNIDEGPMALQWSWAAMPVPSGLKSP
mmetsp:Transcript_49199/g.107266  ORF Transcript_49199/g.107266 Transcript_49199/m.107266 type:complete len:221 (-) Transcript_49199:383-1045(-)